jgi:gas vesicle protein
MQEAQEVRGMLDKHRLGTFVLGGIAGVLAGILFAPKSGKELRGSITSRAGEARERARETYFEAQEMVQERIAEARDRSPRFQEEAYTEEESTVDTFPRLEPVASEPIPDVGSPAETPPDPTPLRDVSWGSPRPASGEEDPEEIRRRIREARSRLRARLEAREAGDAAEERDG